jgi:hypothetical protein
MGVAAGAGAVWWVAGARPRTLTAAMVTGGAGVLLGAAGALSTADRVTSAPGTSARAAWLAWGALAAAVVLWSLLGLTGRLGSPHPTLTTLTTSLTDGRATRALLFGVWTTAGWKLARARAG